MRRPFWISYLEFLDFFHLKTLEKHHWSNSNQTNENSLTWPEIQTYCKKVEFFLVKKSEKGLSQYGWWCSVWWLKIFLTMTCLTKLFPGGGVQLEGKGFRVSRVLTLIWWLTWTYPMKRTLTTPVDKLSVPKSTSKVFWEFKYWSALPGKITTGGVASFMVQ